MSLLLCIEYTHIFIDWFIIGSLLQLYKKIKVYLYILGRGAPNGLSGCSVPVLSS